MGRLIASLDETGHRASRPLAALGPLLPAASVPLVLDAPEASGGRPRAVTHTSRPRRALLTAAAFEWTWSLS